MTDAGHGEPPQHQRCMEILQPVFAQNENSDIDLKSLDGATISQEQNLMCGIDP